jgi:hypothetical protein
MRDGLEALLHIRQLDNQLPVLHAPKKAPEALASCQRHGHLDLGVITYPALEIAGAHKRTVDAR